jgi:secreted PhoX family phosphatase
MSLSRRHFLALASASSLSAVLPGFCTSARGQQRIGYGELVADPDGILDLPAGFQYRIISKLGDRMDDGTFVPNAADGMAAFDGALAGFPGSTILIRNHELTAGHITRVAAAKDKLYDPLAHGGTTTLVVNRDRQLVKQFVSLAGTVRNCAGGKTPWGSWISCEEDTSTPENNETTNYAPVSKRHGYNFEVPVSAIAPVEPQPLIAMGRFNHEAIAVDPRTSIVYQTEDRPDSLFYRFIPNQPKNLSAGGKLEALKIKDLPQAITAKNFPVGQPMAVEWVAIAEVDPDQDTVRVEGFSKGAAQFTRGEGICYSEGAIYFTCTNGGAVQSGQVWRYEPDPDNATGGTIALFMESDNPNSLSFPDNICMAAWGDMFVCEDGLEQQQHIVGITSNGEMYRFAHNALNRSEFAGVCFSADFRTMFLNIYNPTLTFAIWGDWV